jgi:enterochelin esterase-like enzyme
MSAVNFFLMARMSEKFHVIVTAMVLFILSISVSPSALSQPSLESASTASRKTKQSVAWVTRAIPASRVEYRTFESKAAATTVSYHVYKPAAYEREPWRRFPVVYWLHGSGGGLSGIPVVARHFDAAIRAGKTPPSLVVFVNGLEMGMYVDWSNGAAPVESVIVRDLVPHIDAEYRTIATREGRLLDGFSMGGYGAARLGFKYPEMFRAISIVGAGPLQQTLTRTPRSSHVQADELLARVYGGSQAEFRAASPRIFASKNAAKIGKNSLVRIVIGRDDETYDNNAEFHSYLKSLGIPHEWIILDGVGHNPEAVLWAMGDNNWDFYTKAFGGQ